MPKGLVLGLPSHSFSKSFLLVMDVLAAAGYELIYYNMATFSPPADRPYQFVAYPDVPGGYDASNIDADITYFQFGELLMDTTAGVIDFLAEEVRREKPDVIFHSHLGVWGKYIAKYFSLPAIVLNTVIVLDRRIMQPYFKKMREGLTGGVGNVIDGVGLYRKTEELYRKLAFSGVPDLWDVYVNRGQLNICLFPEFLQPQRTLLCESYKFTGCPFEHPPGEQEKTLVYVAMGTILTGDIPLYRRCIRILEEIGLPGLLSVGNKIDIVELGPVKGDIRLAAFVDQPEVLKRSRLFISRGGMASMLEAIQTLTPMIIIPIIAEQRLNAEKIAALGVGIYLQPTAIDDKMLKEAILEILDHQEKYGRQLSILARQMNAVAARQNLLEVVNAHFDPQTVVDLFLRQAKGIPDAIALCSGEEEVSYRGLDLRSRRLAFRLVEAGLKDGEAVPVWMEHGTGMVIAMLGIMRAGGVYVPLDAGYPAERLAYLLQDTGCRIVVSDRWCVGRLPAELKGILLDDEGEGMDMRGEPPIPLLPRGQDAAYIIYTSGSTGKPKGVVVEHAQLYRYIMDVSVALELKDCRSYAMLGTFAADAGLTAVFGALCFGARLDLIYTKNFTSRAALRESFRNRPVDCYKITPSLLGLLLEDADMQVVLPRQRLIVGGETFSRHLACKVHGMLSVGCRLYNHYGPTETTVGVLTYRFPDSGAEFPAVIPLGRPLAHVQIYLLDAEMQEVEDNVAAELYVGGDLVAREYLNKPELTAERFLLYECEGGPVRIYRTGDIARRLPDGTIEYLGREDDQVKISGYRIELKEVEQAILGAGGIRDCIVLARENAEGTKRLVSYVLPGERYDRGQVLALLRNRLPGYMMPGCWVELPEWPLTINNKIDRRALPDSRAGDEVVQDAWDTRARVRAVWSRLLECEIMDTGINFFELGGDSILLMKLTFEIERLFGTEIPVSELYRHLTIDRMTAWLDAKTGTACRQPGNAEGFDPQKTSMAQRNFFFLKRLYPDESFPNASISFHVTGDLDIQRLESALNSVVGMHESLRTGFFLEEGNVIRRVLSKADLSLIQVQAGDETIDQVINRLTKPFDLGKPPLMRALLIHGRGDDRWFHLDMPHIVSDGNSLQVIMDDLVGLYNTGCPDGRRPGFTDFQRYFHTYTTSRQYREDEAYWEEWVRQEDVALRLGSGSAGRLPRFAGSGVTMMLSTELMGRLNGVARNLGITRFQLFLGVYYLLLYKITGQSRLTVMVPVHNRFGKGSERMVGLLANVIPVRMDIDVSSTMPALFARCKRSLLAATAHQQFPFEKIVEMRARNGGGVKSMMSTFFGWHAGAGVLRLGKAVFRLHVPVRNKESLPLSVAIFDNDPSPAIRFSATLEAYSTAELKAIAERYIRLLEMSVLADGTIF